MREGITRAIPDGGSFVRIPVKIANQTRQLKVVERDLREATGGREPRAAELAESFEWDLQRTAMVGGTGTLDRQLPGVAIAGYRRPLARGGTRKRQSHPRALLCPIELATLPDEAVEALSPREKTIITHRFGPHF